AADEDRVEIENDVVERDVRLLDRAKQILVSLERTLEQIGVLDEAAIGVDELALVLEERNRLQRRGQRSEGAVHRHLARARIDGQLRLDRHRRLAIAARNVKALDLDVPEHLQV